MAYRDTVHCGPHEGGRSHCVGNRGVMGFRVQGRQLTGIIMLGSIGGPLGKAIHPFPAAHDTSHLPEPVFPSTCSVVVSSKKSGFQGCLRKCNGT